MTTGPEGLPWPDGSPGAIEAAAGRVRGMADQVGRIAGRTAELADVGGWTGPASVVHAAAMSAHAGTLARGAGPLGTGADLREIERQPWAGEDDRFGATPGWWPLGGSPTNPLAQQPGDRWWETPVHEPADTVH